jgi:hypothetical protein
MFDNYSLKARYFPVIIFLFPIAVIGFFYSLQFDSIFHFLASLGVVGALTYLFSQLGRDQGKLKEPYLWKSWGGMPSIQLLRLRDPHFDKHTKQRYHQKLQTLCPVSTNPDTAMENDDPQAADDVYNAWTKYLISQSRDNKKFSLLYKENVSYGFRRNVWGLRPLAITFSMCLLIANYLFFTLTLNTFYPQSFPNSFIYSSLSIILIILFWLFIVTKPWVKLVAFSYAERLCECADNL